MINSQHKVKGNNLAKRDRNIVWHPFTQMKTARMPIPIVKAKDAILYAEDGSTYIDAVSSWWVNIHGHSNEYIAKKVYEQFLTLEHVIFAGFTHPAAVELSERVVALLPDNLTRVFFSDNGSTAVEVGLKMAFQYWQNINQKRTKVVALRHAYHGDTFGAMSVSGRSTFTEPFFPFLFDVLYIDAPTPGHEQESFEQLQMLLNEHENEIAAFIYEPLVQGAGGMIMYSAEALNILLSMCRQQQVLCIADEVMTGFGRTGKLFASQYVSEKPDIICLSKGLTGGTMALSLTVATEKIYKAFLSNDKRKTLFHGHSFTANPVACAASLASLDLLIEQNGIAKTKAIIEQHEQFATQIFPHPKLIDCRQTGTILALELKTNEGTSYFNNHRDFIEQFCLKQGVLLRPLGNVLYVLPPYCITKTQLQKVYATISHLLTAL